MSLHPRMHFFALLTLQSKNLWSPTSEHRGRLEVSHPKWLLNNDNNFPLQHTAKHVVTQAANTSPSQEFLLYAFYVFWLLDFGPDGLYYVAVTLYVIILKGNHYANKTQAWLQN